MKLQVTRFTEVGGSILVSPALPGWCCSCWCHCHCTTIDTSSHIDDEELV